MGLLRDLVELSGWDRLTTTAQATAVFGAAGGLAVVLLARVLFGGRGWRRRCQFCGARIERGEAPFDRDPICWRCW